VHGPGADARAVRITPLLGPRRGSRSRVAREWRHNYSDFGHEQAKV
jgi:hypothetical protein